MKYHIQAARLSELSPLAHRIIFVDYEKIGTSEQIRIPGAVNELEDSIRKHGYIGPPIAVFQAHADTLFESIRPDTELKINYGELGVADGHHRLEAIKRLMQKGLLSQNRLPVLLLPAHDASAIRTATLHADESPLTLAAIEYCFSRPDEFIPPKSTTHFLARLTNGQWVRIFDALPNIVIPARDLITANVDAHEH